MSTFAPIPYRNNVIDSRLGDKRRNKRAPIPYRNNVIEMCELAMQLNPRLQFHIGIM